MASLVTGVGGKLLGAAASGLGGFLSSSGSNDASEQAAQQAQFNPFNISGPGGNVSFNGQNISTRFDPTQQLFSQIFQGGAQDFLRQGPENQAFLNFANQVGNNAIPGLFQGAMGASQQLPAGAFQGFQDFSQQNALGAQQAGFGGLNMAQQMATGGGMNEGIAQQLFGQGFGALNNNDFSGIAADQLARSRQLARPGEERAVNAKFQNLFNTGNLSATGGERQVGELALAQEQADIQRQFGADQFANQLRQQNRQFGLGSIGQGIGARGQDLQSAQLFGNLGQGLLGFGQQAAGQGLGAATQFSDLINSRAQQRLANANQQFGFGQQAGQQNLNQLLQMFGGSSALNQDLRNQTALAGNISGTAAGAGGNAAQYTAQTGGSGVGSLLSGFGGGLLSTFT